MLHHGTAPEKLKALEFLYAARGTDLLERGIEVSFDQLKKMYKGLSDDD
jgi:hypothetical protein